MRGICSKYCLVAASFFAIFFIISLSIFAFSSILSLSHTDDRGQRGREEAAHVQNAIVSEEEIKKKDGDSREYPKKKVVSRSSVELSLFQHAERKSEKLFSMKENINICFIERRIFLPTMSVEEVHVKDEVDVEISEEKKRCK